MCTCIGKQQKESSLINNNNCHSLGPQILILIQAMTIIIVINIVLEVIKNA